MKAKEAGGSSIAGEERVRAPGEGGRDGRGIEGMEGAVGDDERAASVVGIGHDERGEGEKGEARAEDDEETGRAIKAETILGRERSKDTENCDGH
jgi:hypothetical protein